jgi:flavin reductase (DIM6/NTAB) family NADH-FMN oxidoreductase RutF
MSEPTSANAYQSFDCAELSSSQIYHLLTHCVAPRPIAFVSTISAAGMPNLAPFSYFMAGGTNPPSVAFSPNTNRHGQPKDTLRNIQETREYVINIVSYEICAGMNLTSADFPPDVSEWEPAGFTPAPTIKVRPARVAESLLAMECRLHQIVPHGQGSAAANYVIGEVVYFHVADHVLVNGEIDPTRIDYVSRMGGDWYARANQNCMFELPRPKN